MDSAMRAAFIKAATGIHPYSYPTQIAEKFGDNIDDFVFTADEFDNDLMGEFMAHAIQAAKMRDFGLEEVAQHLGRRAMQYLAQMSDETLRQFVEIFGEVPTEPAKSAI